MGRKIQSQCFLDRDSWRSLPRLCYWWTRVCLLLGQNPRSRPCWQTTDMLLRLRCTNNRAVIGDHWLWWVPIVEVVLLSRLYWCVKRQPSRDSIFELVLNHFWGNLSNILQTTWAVSSRRFGWCLSLRGWRRSCHPIPMAGYDVTRRCEGGNPIGAASVSSAPFPDITRHD